MNQLAEMKQYRGNIIHNIIDRKEGNFTLTHNTLIEDTNLSDGAFRILMYIKSKKDKTEEGRLWTLNQNDIANRFKIDIRTVEKKIQELKNLGYIKVRLERNRKTGFFISNYETFEEPLDIKNRQLKVAYVQKSRLDRKLKTTRLFCTNPPDQKVGHIKIKNIINTNDDNKKNNHHSLKIFQKKKEEEISPYKKEESKGNNLVEFSDKSDKSIVKKSFDNLLNFKLDLTINEIEKIKKFVSDFLKANPTENLVKTIEIFPQFVQANKIKNQDKNYSDNQALVYLKKILLGDCQYPSWFASTLKIKVKDDNETTLKNKWQRVCNVWNVKGSKIDESLVDLALVVLNDTYETYQHRNKDLSDNFIRRRKGYIEKCFRTIDMTNLSELIQLFKEITSREYIKNDQRGKLFKEVLAPDSGFTLETAKEIIIELANSFGGSF